MDQCCWRVACHGVVLSLFCLFLRPAILFPFCCVLGANTKVDQCFRQSFRSFFWALGNGVLRLIFLVALRFKCTLASLFLLLYLLYLFVLPWCFLFFCCLCGDQQKVDQRFWRVACHGVLCFRCSFLAGRCALVFFVYFFVLPWCFLLFELFSWWPALFLELHSGFRPLCFVVLLCSRAMI